MGENKALDGACNGIPVEAYGLLPTAFGGHCYYVRRCYTGGLAQIAKSDMDRQVGGIILPECLGNAAEWGEVLGVGPRVGLRCSADHARKYRSKLWEQEGRAACMARMAPDDMVGKLVHIPLLWPFKDVRAVRSPVAYWEFFIEESLPTMVWEGAEQAERVA